MKILYQKSIIPGVAKCCAGRFIINNKMRYYPSRRMLLTKSDPLKKLKEVFLIKVE